MRGQLGTILILSGSQQRVAALNNAEAGYPATQVPLVCDRLDRLMDQAGIDVPVATSKRSARTAADSRLPDIRCRMPGVVVAFLCNKIIMLPAPPRRRHATQRSDHAAPTLR